MTIRAFIAIETSVDIQKKMEELTGRLKKGASFSSVRPSWVKPANAHLTLKFLGNIEESQLEHIARLMRAACAGISPFSLEVGGLGVFPNERQPRVLWIGIKNPGNEIISMQKLLDQGLATLGFETEKHAFHPHLTIARFKYLKGTAAFMEVIHEHQNLSNLGDCIASELILFQSKLHPDGAIYIPLKKIKFGESA